MSLRMYYVDDIVKCLNDGTESCTTVDNDFDIHISPNGVNGDFYNVKIAVSNETNGNVLTYCLTSDTDVEIDKAVDFIEDLISRKR